MKKLVLKTGNFYGVGDYKFYNGKPIEVDDKMAKYLLSKVRTLKINNELVEVNIFEEYDENTDTRKKSVAKVKKSDKGGK